MYASVGNAYKVSKAEGLKSKVKTSVDAAAPMRLLVFAASA